MARTHLGITFAYNTNLSTPSWTDFAGVTSITPPENTMKEVDATHMASTGEVEEWLPGFISSGALEAELQYLYTLANVIDDFFHARTIIQLKITIPDDNGSSDSTIVATGFINKWRIHDQVTPGKTTSLRSSFGFKCTGKVTYTPAT